MSDVGRGQMTSETGVAVHVKASKEQQRAERGARRLQEFQEGKRAEQCTAHWLPFIRRVYYRGRSKERSDVWTQWMRNKQVAPCGPRESAPLV